MKYILSVLFSIFIGISLQSQVPDYVTNKFAYQVIQNVEYGKSIAYNGAETTLLLDIYKPINDKNCHRPLMVLVHGGAWIGGTKEDPNMVNMAKELAAKGWVVASINYRLGVHTTSFYTPYVLCPANNPALCARVCDTTEVFRAIYRGLQDTRGAIRFMKERNEIDSIDVKNTFVGGESAGAFISLYTAFLDKDSEKPLSCLAIADAPVSDPYLNYCHGLVTALQRPDLGSIHGDLHVGLYDDSVQGVADIYGGLSDMSIMNDNIMPLYIFHQASDLLVNYKRGRLLGRLSGCLNNICEPFYNMPLMYGGSELAKYYKGLGIPDADYKAEILENSTVLDCTVNPPGHSIDNLKLRTQHIADLFVKTIQKNGNDPNEPCTNAVVENKSKNILRTFPNPGTKDFSIFAPSIANQVNKISLIDMMGNKLELQFQALSNGIITVNIIQYLSPGYYICEIISNDYIYTTPWICSGN